ncbi:hypothetical protein U1Q18_001376 [Sarracenia purpurea var. burkii]
MERGFQALLMGYESPLDFSPEFIDKATDDACVDGMYSTMNAQYLFHSPDYGYGTFHQVAPMSVDPVSVSAFASLGEDFPATRSEEVCEFLANDDRRLKPGDFVARKLKMPKNEPMNNEEVNDMSIEPFNFISKSCDSISMLCDSRFRQLPDLRCLEHAQDNFAFTESSSKKRVKLNPFSQTNTDPRTLELMIGNFQISNQFTGLNPPEVQVPTVVPQSVLARQRRQRISDKTRCLQKLLPWDKKMDMATVLEEAYKYVKFLQAQISVLQCMPCHSLSFTTKSPSNGNMFGGLGRLNRQQLLEVLVNSPVAQTILCSQGCCVYSIEQLILLKKMAERKALYQQMLFDPSMHP